MKVSKILISAFLIFAGTVYAQDALQKTVTIDEKEADQLASLNASVSPEKAIMKSSSSVNWVKKTFSSNVSLNMKKAGFPLPAGKSSAVNRIKMELPALVKDPLLALYVDDSQSLNELVLENTITLEQLTKEIEKAKQTPAFFDKTGNDLQTSHTIQLQQLGALLIKHRTPYSLQKPIDRIATRSYSGIVIDARGTLPVFGEFTESKVDPALFPKIWNEDMDLLYEKNMVEADIASGQGIVQYDWQESLASSKDRVGNDPLWITAKQVYGINRVDPVISTSDYLKIACSEANRNLLKQGKIVILLDKDQLIHAAGAAEKNKRYYLMYEEIKRVLIEDKVPQTVLTPPDPATKMIMNNLQFIADEAVLLPAERPRIQTIAKALKTILKEDGYTILVEGHTADVNKPNGQMKLSIERAQAIINALTEEGIPRSIFTYKGYGGTMPVADNSTPDGRAQNRRVVITIMPKTSFEQRK